MSSVVMSGEILLILRKCFAKLRVGIITDIQIPVYRFLHLSSFHSLEELLTTTLMPKFELLFEK